MRTVWKYPITLEHEQEIEMQEGAKILTVHKQGNRHDDDISIWCEVDSDAPKVVNKFLLVPSGEEVPENAKYIGTLWLMTGSYVLHMFEEQKG